MDVLINRYFRDELRNARASALRDAEGFQEILFTLERLGITLYGEVGDLGKYGKEIQTIANNSPLASEIPNLLRESHLPFDDLYELVKDARNDALHQGAAARHLTGHAIQLAIILEDALMSDTLKVSDYMVRDPICAFTWQPISLARQHMLANSFSYLPILIETPNGKKWYFVADYNVALYLRQATTKDQRKKRLAKNIGEAYKSNELNLVPADSCRPEDLISTITSKLCKGPVLVTKKGKEESLLGIVTAFDLL